MTDKFLYKNDDRFADYWNRCMSSDLPYIVIHKGRKYSRVEFDVFPMLQNHRATAFAGSHLPDIYKAYSTFFSLPNEHFLYAGGSNNAIFKVKAEQAEFVASGLFDFLVNFVRRNRIPG